MISREEVQHIAHLARIKLTDEEIEKFQMELSLILDYMETLKKVDTKNIIPLTGATFLHNRMRKDEPVLGPEVAAAVLNEAPEKHNGYVKVKAIF